MRSLRIRDNSGAPAPALPAVIEEELWFGGHDPTAAEDTAARSMAALVGRIVGAKPFPESARRLADLTAKDVVRIEPVIQVLERDPALSAKLLRLVNSAGYALQQRCTSVRHAATLVGTDRLHQIATTAAVLDLFDSRGSIAARVIEHCTIVGAFCRYFGAHLALPVDDLFTAGFLHDIGKLMLLETEGDQYVELLERHAEQPDAIHIAERSLYGFDHAVLAAHVLTAWSIPDPVPKIVAWHHDPTRAYRVSSMMAALVQTVRLADAAVCAVVRGATQSEFAALANSESASYLDISEPQLASMWDELQTLYRESIEQCRGDVAPALDPRSLRPRNPLSMAAAAQSRSTELPLQYPCVVCGGPTFGNTCRACGGHMCPAHQVGREDWCTLCARDYQSVESEAPVAISWRLAIVAGIATTVVSIAIGYDVGGAVGGVRAGIGTTLLLVLAAVLVVVTRRLVLRFRFIRTRPDRTINEALENDGGVQSLIPPVTDISSSAGESHRDRLSAQIRISGAMVEHVTIRDVASIPPITSPHLFDGLGGASGSIVPRAQAMSEPAAGSTESGRSNSIFDSARLMMQGVSLVTLPAPANSRDSEQRHLEPTNCISNEQPQAPAINASGAGEVQQTEDGAKSAVVRISEAPGPVAPGAGEDSTEAAVAGEPVGATVRQPQPTVDEPNANAAAPLPTTSNHPLAALGLQPRAAARPTSLLAEHPLPAPAPDAATQIPSTADKATPSAPTIEAQAGIAGSTPHKQSPTTSDAAAEPVRAVEPEPAVAPAPAVASLEPVRAVEPEPAAAPAPAVASLEPVRAVEPEPAAAPAPAVASLEPVRAVEPEPAAAPRAGVESGDTSDVAAFEKPISPLPRVTSQDALSDWGAVSPVSLPKAVAPAPTFPFASGTEALLQPLVAALGPEMASRLGPEFQAKVMELVAERVASALAEQMLQSLGQQGSTPSVRPRASRAPQAKAPREPVVTPINSEIPAEALTTKRPRKRATKQ